MKKIDIDFSKLKFFVGDQEIKPIIYDVDLEADDYEEE
jgi:hypothetical protein